jgi:tetratricopeptide (TPR) repeat protein
MRDFEALYTEMQAEDIEPHVEELEAKIGPKPFSANSPGEIERLFEYMQGLIMLNRHAEASAVFTALRPIIDTYRENHPDSEAALDYFFEWSMLALRLTVESRSTFVSLPLYHELLETFDNGPVALRYRAVQARAQLVRHLDFWIGKGGNPDNLEAEDMAFIRLAKDEYVERSEAAIEEVLEREDYVAAVRLLKNAAQFYLMMNRPNDVIAAFKEALEYVPLTPNYHESDLADIYMQLGQVFMGYKKFDVAKRYFTQARDIYEAGGDDLEMLAFQADGWVEEVSRKIKA